jgi:hypothetical protein
MNLLIYSALTIKFDHPSMNLINYKELIIKFDYPLVYLIINEFN